MEFIEDGQFDDADDDNTLESVETGTEIVSKKISGLSVKHTNQTYEWDTDECEEEEEEECLENVQWSRNASIAITQYQRLTGKISSGTNRQEEKQFKESLINRAKNMNLGECSATNRKIGEDVSKVRDKSDRATVENALDNKTMTILAKWSKKLFPNIHGVVSTGKEANVYYAVHEDGRHCAIKIYKTVGTRFRNRDQYMVGERRFQYNTCTKDIRKLVPKWAEKEFKNLNRVFKSGIPCPEPILMKCNIVVMTFLGDDGEPAARLKDCILSAEEAEQLYRDCIKIMRKMFQECKLVHGDLSEYNMLVVDGVLHVIDVSQSLEMDNPNALNLLRMDIRNVTSYFRSKGVATMMHSKLLELIMLKDINVETFTQQAVDSVSGEDFEEVVQTGISRSTGEVDSFSKDARRVDDHHTVYQPIEMDRETECVDEEEDDDDDEEEEDVSKADNVEENDKKEDGESDQKECGENDKKESVKVDGKSKKIKADPKMCHRPRDESLDSKKERKKCIKELQRINRENKIPKAEKKRRIKLSKNIKS